MGQISGVNAQSITYIAGVSVASISYVGPISAATLGLGGGGGPTRVFTNAAWSTQEEPCIYGAESIPKKGSQIVYYNSEDNTIYTDVEFTTPFLGYSLYWWDQTDNKWWWVNNEGGVIDSGMCGGGDTGKTFANLGDWGEPAKACHDGPNYIDKGGETTVLYYNPEDNRLYYNSTFTTEPFYGTGNFYWNQTDNQWWLISGEGYVEGTGNCG